MNDALIATYAAILNEEKQVAFLIEDTEALAVICENVGGDVASWNVDFLDSNNVGGYSPVDGGHFTGNEHEAVKYVVALYEQWVRTQRGE